MRLGIFVSTVLILALCASNAFSLSNDVDAPSDANDPNSHHFVWVVALEKDFPGQGCNNWSPTLYKISVEAGKVVEKKKVAEQGAPGFCYPLPDDRIRVILKEGIASNGTYPWDEMTIDLALDKSRMGIVETKTSKGYPDDVEEYRKSVRSDKNKRLNINAPKHLVKKRGEAFLGTSKSEPRAFMLRGFLRDKGNPSLDILDPNSLMTTESIAVKPGNRKLGGFSGAEWGDVILLAERYVICLFDGASRLGTFAPGYVMIVDTKAKTVKYVAIGSDPARGIAY